MQFDLGKKKSEQDEKFHYWFYLFCVCDMFWVWVFFCCVYLVGSLLTRTKGPASSVFQKLITCINYAGDPVCPKVFLKAECCHSCLPVALVLSWNWRSFLHSHLWFLNGTCKNVDLHLLLTRLLQNDKDTGRHLPWWNFCPHLHLHSPSVYQSFCKSCLSAAPLSELKHRGCETNSSAWENRSSSTEC